MKLALAAAVVGILAATVALSQPAFAESTASCRGDSVIGPDGQIVNSIVANRDLITTQLQRRGYNVEDVESWGGCIKAFVDEPDGTSHIGFFDPDTLEPLTTN